MQETIRLVKTPLEEFKKEESKTDELKKEESKTEETEEIPQEKEKKYILPYALDDSHKDLWLYAQW